MNQVKRLRCRELIELLSLYVDGELGEERVLEIEAHLEVCPQCVAYLQSFRAAVRLGKASVDDEECEDIPDDLVRAVLGKVKG